MTRKGLKALEGERVVLQTRDDRSLRGVLAKTYRDSVVIANFEYLDEAKATDMPGEALVLLDNLSWVHRLQPVG